MPAPFLFSRVLRPHEFVIASDQCGRGPFGRLRAGSRTQPVRRPAVHISGGRYDLWLRNLLNSKGLFWVQTSHLRSTKGAYTPLQRRMIIDPIGPFPKRSQWCRRGRKLESHRDERAHLSPRTAHRLTCAGFCRPGTENGESCCKTAEQRPGRARTRAHSRAIGRAPMKDVAGIERDFDWSRGGVPKPGIAAPKVER